MDETARKIFLQLDDEAPGVRSNAFEALRDHLQKAGRKFRDFVADLESAMPAAKADELRQKLAEYAKANEKAQKNETSLKGEVARLKAELKAALWVKANWKICGAVAAGLIAVVAGVCAYQRYWSRSEAVNMGLRAAVASASWNEGWGEPFAAKIGGEPWWLLYWGDLDASSYSDNRGNVIEMRCVHLYAAPATPYSGQFFKPSPRNFLGWVAWPELATQCKPSPNQRADSFK
jgi:hypothetical protein